MQQHGTTIEALLKNLSLEKYIPKFKEEEITLEVAKGFSDSDLQALGLPMGPRKALLKALQEGGSTVQSTGGGGDRYTAMRAKFSIANIEAATNNMVLALNTRRNIAEHKQGFDRYQAKIAELCGPEWCFSFDYEAIFHATKAKATPIVGTDPYLILGHSPQHKRQLPQDVLHGHRGTILRGQTQQGGLPGQDPCQILSLRDHRCPSGYGGRFL